MSDIHILTIKGCEGCVEAGEQECTCIPQQFDVEVTCPGVTEDCRAWWECMECDAASDELREQLWETGEAHGIEHRQIGDLGWATPGADCILVVHDEIHEIVTDSFPGDVKPGTYRVRIITDEVPGLEFAMEAPA